jgi:hypothetical protein
MMVKTMSRYTNPTPQYLDGSGDQVCFGKLYFYETETNTLKNTYADSIESIPNTNPIELDAAGRTPNAFYSGSARVVLTDCNGSQIWERDPVESGGSGASGLGAWVSTVSYSLNDIVSYNSIFYISLISGNLGNTPDATPASNPNWMQVDLIPTYNTTHNYAIGEVVRTTEGYLWRGLTSPNTGNNPITNNGTNWVPAVNGAKIAEVITLQADVDALEALNSWDNPETADFNAVKNESRQVDASANTVDISLPVLVAGDSFIFHNMISSTFKVQVLNPTQTIKGSAGDISATTNMEIEAGQSVQLVAVSATVLSIVGALL